MYAIELPRELLGRLARLRERNGRPISHQVREAVEIYCQQAEAAFDTGAQPEPRKGDSA